MILPELPWYGTALFIAHLGRAFYDFFDTEIQRLRIIILLVFIFIPGTLHVPFTVLSFVFLFPTPFSYLLSILKGLFTHPWYLFIDFPCLPYSPFYFKLIFLFSCRFCPSHSPLFCFAVLHPQSNALTRGTPELV